MRPNVSFAVEGNCSCILNLQIGFLNMSVIVIELNMHKIRGTVFPTRVLNIERCMSNKVADAQLCDRTQWGELQSLSSFPLVLHMLQMQMAFNRKHESREQKCSKSTDVSFLHGLLFISKGTMQHYGAVQTRASVKMQVW